VARRPDLVRHHRHRGTWSGVGGSESLVATLLRDDRLETVRQRYDDQGLR
jgi:hypothetical protein